MKGWPKGLVAVLLVLSVLVVFVSPAVELQPTAVRAGQCALVIAFALMAAAFILCGIRKAPVALPAPTSSPGLVNSALELLEFECTRLC